MAYVQPATVCAPKASIRSVQILYNSGPGGWSVASIDWEGSEAIGIRWNGKDGPGIGNPQSRGNATWFILPNELKEVILARVDDLAMSGPGGLIEGYTAMANDAAREREAEEWSEGLIGDASAQGEKLYPGEAMVMLNGEQSKAKADQIATASKQRLRSKAGSLSSADLSAVEKAVLLQLGIRR